MVSKRLTRRQVLSGTARVGAAWLAAPLVVPSSALGDSKKAPPSERVTVGHIGVGKRGWALFRAFQRLRDVQSVAVADCYQARREALAKLCGGRAYQDFREILERDDVDAVVVATPDHWHVPIANMAARAGKHAYVEKPLGISIHHDLVCRRVFEKAGVVFQYGTQQRSMAHCHLACEQVKRGVLGKIKKIEVDCPNGSSGGSTKEVPVPPGFDYDMWLGPAPVKPYTVDRCKPPGTYWIYDQSIGYLAGWGAHPLDLMVWACDADLSGPVVVEGTGVVPTEGLYDTVYNWDMKILLGDVELIFRPGGNRTKFIGENGWIQVSRSRERTQASDPSWLTAKLDPAECRLPVSSSQQGNFIEAVKKGDPNAAVSNLPDAVRSDVISHLCDIAVRTGERIVWDPKTEKLVEGSEKAQAMLQRALRAPWTL